MTTIDLYKQLSEGKITQSKFLYEVRRDSNLPWILNTTSFKDAVSILKNKGIIREMKINESITDEETTRIIDRLNPYVFNKALFSELDKLPVVNDETYSKTRTKVAKKLQKDPNAYRDEQFANSKDVAKADEKLQMVPVKKDNFTDEKRGMTKIKGQTIAKSNTRTTKKENKKGKPKGVKEMTYNAKTAKGIAKVMPSTGVEKIMESLLNKLFKKKVELTEDFHHEYGHGQSVPLSEKDCEAFGVKTGIVKEINGGTLTLELEVLDETGMPLEIHRQINAISLAKSDQTQSNEPKLADKSITIKDRESGQDYTFNIGDKVIDPQDKKEVTITSFMKDNDGHIKALVNKGQFFVAIPLDVLDRKESDEDYRAKIFKKLPNLGKSAQQWLNKQDSLDETLRKLMKLAKAKKIKKETVDIVTGVDSATGEDITIATTPAGQGRKALQKYKASGATSVKVQTIK